MCVCVCVHVCVLVIVFVSSQACSSLPHGTSVRSVGQCSQYLIIRRKSAGISVKVTASHCLTVNRTAQHGGGDDFITEWSQRLITRDKEVDIIQGRRNDVMQLVTC